MRRSQAPSNAGKRARTATSNTSRRVSNPQRPLRNKAIVYAGNGFPARMRMVHKYADTVAITVTTGGGLGYRYRFSCNGMYDPDKTGTGHQPLFFDQMADLYNHYTVVGSKIEVRFISANSTTVPIDVVISKDDDQTTALTTITEAREQSGAVSGIVPPGNDTVVSLSNTWSAKKTFGGDPLSRKEVSGDATANPTETTEFNLWAGTAATGGPYTVYAQVMLTYIAYWDELKEKTSS